MNVPLSWRRLHAPIAWTILAAALALSACEQATPPSPPAAPIVPARTDDPAAADAATEDAVAAEWARLAGAWAPDGRCGDDIAEWRIERQSFHFHDMHCRIDRLELIDGGVRAVAACVIAGEDDKIPDVFKFVRREDGSLSTLNEANQVAHDGLRPCGGGAP